MKKGDQLLLQVPNKRLVDGAAMVLDPPAPPNLLQQPLLPSQPHFSHPHRRDPRRYLPISLPLHAFALLALCSSWTQTNSQNTCVLLLAQGN